MIQEKNKSNERFASDSLANALLDSSLISRTNFKSYSIKIIQCGDYYQVYKFQDTKFKNINKKDKLKDKISNIDYSKINNNIKNVDTENLYKNNNNKNDKENTIQLKNIMRSKFQLQRIVKANEEEFKTFITLTFAENITSIKEANKIFDNWRRCIKRIKPDFKYIGVPEFQKRGAVHYHLLTNLKIKEDNNIIILQDNKKNMYDVKYWNRGYSSVFNLKDINIVGYITKYMTKDIDNRLFGKRRYFYSKNLKLPNTIYLNLSNLIDFKAYIEILDYHTIYENKYCDKFGEIIEFKEYKKIICNLKDIII